MTVEVSVHPSAVVEDGARLADGVRIGPFCHVGPEVVLGEGVMLHGHVTVTGATTLGAGSSVYPGAALGGPPQNLRHRGGHTTLEIGRNCVIREGVTIHVGSDNGHHATTVGNDCYIMGYSHIGHDSIVGSNVVMSNFAALAGHAEIGDHVIISGYAAVHQFVRVGHHAFLGGFAAVVGDVIPYGMAVGDRARLRGFNVVGLKRAGMSRAQLHELRRAYRMLFDPAQPLAENIDRVAAEFAGSEKVEDILAFMRARGRRPFTVPAGGAGDEEDDGE